MEGWWALMPLLTSDMAAPGNHKENRGGYWAKRKAAFSYAWRGIKCLAGGEAHMRIHIAVALMVIAAGFFFRISSTEWCAVSLCIGGVFMAEGFNTALERVCDRVSHDYHPLIRDAKDIAAGAVLLFVMAAVAVGLIIFIPKIYLSISF